MKRAVIIGCLGQDGTILYEYLIKKNYQVIGIDKNHLISSFEFSDKIIDITNENHVDELVKSSCPDEIYYLAAIHNSSEDNIKAKNAELFKKSFEINANPLIFFFEACLKYSKTTRLFYAASSHVFGNSSYHLQDETTPINPLSIYAISKAAGLNICHFYRAEYSLFSSCGILYNHESSLKADNFISKKIIKSAIRIKRKQLDSITFGNLSAEVDWGYAPDYVDAMNKILNIEHPDDFIIATGEKHKVAEFIEIAFSFLDLDYKKYVFENKNILQRTSMCLVGNPEKLISETGWQRSLNFKGMIKKLLTDEGAFDE
jgi:GDPmannose 4,6-dehydratase